MGRFVLILCWLQLNRKQCQHRQTCGDSHTNCKCTFSSSSNDNGVQAFRQTNLRLLVTYQIQEYLIFVKIPFWSYLRTQTSSLIIVEVVPLKIISIVHGLGNATLLEQKKKTKVERPQNSNRMLANHRYIRAISDYIEFQQHFKCVSVCMWCFCLCVHGAKKKSMNKSQSGSQSSESSVHPPSRP